MKRHIALLSVLLIITGHMKAAVIIQPDANTVLLWRLNEASGNTYADASTHVFTGTGFDVAAGQITDGQPGILGNAVSMGGTTGRNFIKNSSISSTNFAAGNFTLQIWVENPLLSGADATTGHVIAAQRNTGSGFVDWSLGLTTTGALTLFGNNGGSLALTSSALTWNSNVWYNVSLVADTTGGVTTYTVYRAANGASALTLVATGTGYVPENIGANGVFSIGGDSNSTAVGRRFGGLLDETQYSNVARDQAYLLSSIPEPNVVGLSLLGGLLVFVYCKRRKTTLC